MCGKPSLPAVVIGVNTAWERRKGDKTGEMQKRRRDENEGKVLTTPKA